MNSHVTPLSVKNCPHSFRRCFFLPELCNRSSRRRLLCTSRSRRRCLLNQIPHLHPGNHPRRNLFRLPRWLTSFKLYNHTFLEYQFSSTYSPSILWSLGGSKAMLTLLSNSDILSRADCNSSTPLSSSQKWEKVTNTEKSSCRRLI